MVRPPPTERCASLANLNVSSGSDPVDWRILIMAGHSTCSQLSLEGSPNELPAPVQISDGDEKADTGDCPGNDAKSIDDTAELQATAPFGHSHSYIRVAADRPRARKLARSAILSIALCQPCSASFRAYRVAAPASSTPEFEVLLGSVVSGIGKSEFGCSPVKSSEFGWRQEIAAALQPWRNLSTLSRSKPCPLIAKLQT
jgi:hypothetical protein